MRDINTRKVAQKRSVTKNRYRSIRRVTNVTSRDIYGEPIRKADVTSVYGPPSIGDAVPATNGFAHRIVGVRACVYAIGPADGRPLKIGVANNAKARRDDLQIGNWVPLVIHRLIFGGTRVEAMRLESKLILRFKRERIPGVRGDWFSIDVAAFDAAIREAIHGQP